MSKCEKCIHNGVCMYNKHKKPNDCASFLMDNAFLTSNYKLKECPFCKGKAELVKVSHGVTEKSIIVDAYKVKCKDCGMETHTYQSRIYQNLQGDIVVEANGALKVIAMWNMRNGIYEQM